MNYADKTVLTNLSIASLEEDRYGYVQQVLPSTLEVIIRHRSALMSFQSELIARSAVLGSSADYSKEVISRELVSGIRTCETSISRIVEAFGESLKAFRFPPGVGVALAEISQKSEDAR